MHFYVNDNILSCTVANFLKMSSMLAKRPFENEILMKMSSFVAMETNKYEKNPPIFLNERRVLCMRFYVNDSIFSYTVANFLKLSSNIAVFNENQKN